MFVHAQFVRTEEQRLMSKYPAATDATPAALVQAMARHGPPNAPGVGCAAPFAFPLVFGLGPPRVCA